MKAEPDSREWKSEKQEKMKAELEKLLWVGRHKVVTNVITCPSGNVFFFPDKKAEPTKDEEIAIAEFKKDVKKNMGSRFELVPFVEMAIEQAARNLFLKAEDSAFEKLIEALREKTGTVDVIYHQTMLEKFKSDLKKEKQKTASAIFKWIYEELYDADTLTADELMVKWKKHLSETK